MLMWIAEKHSCFYTIHTKHLKNQRLYSEHLFRRDSLHFVLASGSGPTGIDEDIDLEDVGGSAVPDEVEDEDEDEDTDADETTNVRRKDKRKQARKNALAAKIRNKKRYNVEFTFDCDVDCAITIYYLCTEDITTSAATYTPVKPHYK